MRRIEAASFVVFGLFFSPCCSTAAAAAFLLGLPLGDDTQGKGPRDRVEDHGAWSLGDGPPPAHVVSDESGHVVEAILLELEQLPGVALWQQMEG